MKGRSMTSRLEQPYITGHTRLTGLIGGNVRESFSPEMHTISFEHSGIDAVYLSLNVLPENLEAAVEGARALGFMGCNVTMPHKTYILPYLDDLSPAAKLMGAVNTVKFTEDGMAIGYNTDGEGFTRNAVENGVELKGKTMTIVGAGGAGSAVLGQCAMDGVATIHVFNIKDEFFDKIATRLDDIAQATGAKISLHDLADTEELARCVAESDIFLNATKVGALGMEDQCVLPEEMLHEGLVVADTVYNPKTTKLLAMAREHGNKTLSGIGMLLWQGSVAEEIYAGKAMDVEFVENALFS